MEVLEIFLKVVDQIKTWKKNFFQISRTFLEISENKVLELKKELISTFKWMLSLWILSKEQKSKYKLRGRVIFLIQVFVACVMEANVNQEQPQANAQHVLVKVL